jgi:hypothetical protein
VPGLESFGFLARPQPAIVDAIAFASQEILRLQSVRADVFRHHHAIENGLLVTRHDFAPWIAFSTNVIPIM